jgi:hypothetical protein
VLKVADPYPVNETKKPVADRRPSRKVLMLRAYSSWIVRSVGCAALTLSLATTTCPTFGAPTARSVESLSAAERASLPNATLVTISKTGRTVSLGVLRSEHKLRLQRFANAAMLGKRASLLLAHGGGAPNIGSKFEKKKKRVSSGTLVPMNFSLQNFSAPGMGPFPPGPFPADFLAFCKAAAVTACLYLPSGFKMVYQGAYVWDMDDLITDQTMCTSEGGRPEGGGCAYYYPTEYNLEFNPGPPTAQGYNVTSSATCPSPFENTVDPRGAVSLDVLPNTNTVSYLSLTSLKTCVVRVFVKKLPVRRRLQITLPR